MSICQEKYEDQLKLLKRLRDNIGGCISNDGGFIKHDKNLYKGRVQPTTWWMLIGSG